MGAPDHSAALDCLCGPWSIATLGCPSQADGLESVANKVGITPGGAMPPDSSGGPGLFS